MTFGDVTYDEYCALRAVVDAIDEAERVLGVPFRDHPTETFRTLDEQRARYRATIDGFEVPFSVEPPPDAG